MVRMRPVPALQPVTAADLSDREAAFAREYVERGGKRGAATEAVLAAGITTNRAAARVRASEMMRKPRVIQYLRDEIARRLSAGAVVGTATLIDLAQNAESEQVRFSAARELVDRGYGPVVSKNATVKVTRGWEDVIKAIEAKEASAKAAGAIVDVAGEIVDAEFTTVAEHVD